MANVLTRSCLAGRLWKIKELFSLTAYPCSNIVTHKLVITQNFHRLNSVEIPILPKCIVDLKYYKHYSTSKDDSKEKKCEVADVKAEKLSLFQKFKQMYRDYWYVLVPVHVATSIVWFGGFYYMAKSGIDIVAILESLHVSEKLTNSLKDSSMGYLAVAYALYKISTPARYAVTLGGTTLSINYLNKWGYIKPVPSKQRMKEIYQTKKDNLTKTMKETKDGIIERKDNIMETFHETKEGIKEKKDSIFESVSKTKKHLKEHKSNAKEKITDFKEKT